MELARIGYMKATPFAIPRDGAAIEHGDTAPGSWSAALLTKKQLALKLNLSTRSVDNLQRKKLVPVCRISPRCVRYSLPAVLAALDRLTIREVR